MKSENLDVLIQAFVEELDVHIPDFDKVLEQFKLSKEAICDQREKRGKLFEFLHVEHPEIISACFQTACKKAKVKLQITH